jgi:hypothetical protein
MNDLQMIIITVVIAAVLAGYTWLCDRVRG